MRTERCCLPARPGRLVPSLVPALVLSLGLCCTGVAASGNNPVPYIDLPLIPTSVKPGGPAFTLTVNGAGFLASSVVNLNGSPRATTLASSTQLTAAILASDIASKRTVSVTVTNPSPGGGISNVAFLQVAGAFPTVTLGRPIRLPANATQLAEGDFNHDGIIDLATVDSLSNTVSISLGDGNGTFVNVATYPTGKTPAGIVTGDLNGDSNLDLAVVNAFGNDVSIFLGNGDGTFAVGASFSTGVDPLGVATGDFNQDGKLDLAVANRADNTVSILLGNGDGTFQPRIDTAVGSEPLSLTTGDFNGDGKLDVVTVNQASDTVSALLGNGDGTFQPAVDSAAGGSVPVGLAAADFDGDGKLDLAVTNQSAPTVSVLRGNGDGSFAAPVGYAVPNSSFAAPTVGDFDGEGKLDIIVPQSNTISILRGNGDGTFRPALSTSSPLAGGPLVAADFNGDGRLDLATTAAVFLQTPHAATLTPSSLFFLKQPVGTTSSAEQAKLANTGELPLNISSVTASGSFAQTNACGSTLKVFQGCLISVTFSPTSPGTTGGTLTVTDDATGSPQTVNLVGSGIEVSFSPTALDFGSIPVGMTSSPQTVTVTNVSNQTVSGFSVSISGLNSKDFAQTNTCTSLGPGASCTISATFTPSAAGIRKAVININDSAGLQNVALSGTGT